MANKSQITSTIWFCNPVYTGTESLLNNCLAPPQFWKFKAPLYSQGSCGNNKKPQAVKQPVQTDVLMKQKPSITPTYSMHVTDARELCGKVKTNLYFFLL